MVTAKFRKCFPQLLDNPFRGGVLRKVAVQNLAAFVLGDKEAIQQAESHRRHGEEIECSDYLTVILEKGKPLPTGVTAPNHATRYLATARLKGGRL
jgi:hypothetical protein